MSALPHPRLVFEPMTARDVEAVHALEVTLFDFPWTRNNFVDALAAGYSAWVCRSDAALVGYAVMMLVLDEAHLLNLSVRRDLQGCGIGQRLFDHLFQVARTGGATMMYLEVRPSNKAARALYARNGFEGIGVRRGYYPAGRGREDALVLKKAL